MEDLEVGAVVEDAAVWAGEDASVGVRRVVLEMLVEERDQFGMDGHRAGFAVGAAFEFRALPSGFAVGPPAAATRLGVDQDEFAPAMVRQAGEVVAAQVPGFLGPQRGLVEATEEGHHPLTEFAVLHHRSKQPPDLVAVDHGSRVHALERPRTGPLDGLEGVSVRIPTESER